MPEYVVERTLLALNEQKKAVKGSRILLMGLAYKADVDDMRESPTFELMSRFKALGAEVCYFDPHIPVIGPTREHADWKGVKSIAWNQATVSKFDAAILATNHKAFNLGELRDWSPLTIDCRDAMRSVAGKGRVVRA
jgi:UDP-N-acetyl-D-glucosamine dehydrogenase